MPLYQEAKFELSEGTGALTRHEEAWDALALKAPSPFLTHAWLVQWAKARPREQLACATLFGPGRNLLAGALIRHVPGGFAAAADGESGDWDVVAVDGHARRLMWEELVRLAPWRAGLAQMRVGSPETAVACEAFTRAGFGVLRSVREVPSPYVPLAASLEELLASRSRNTRKQVNRRRRELLAAGDVRLRTVDGGARFERGLDAFLKLEACGWKGRSGTAILSQPANEGLYRGFARAAAERGWARLHLLDLDGDPIAAALVVNFGREGFVLKIGIDESRAHLSPGTTLMAEVIRCGIDERLEGMDLLGLNERFKLRWTDELRPRQRLRMLHGPAGRMAQRGWESAARPCLVDLLDRARKHPQLRARLQQPQRIFDRLGL